VNGTDRDRERDVAALLEAVRAEGDAALRRLTRTFDGVDVPPERLRVSGAARDAALRQLPGALRQAMEEAAVRIRRFHEETRPRDHLFTGPEGELLGEKWVALASAGVYAPGGRAAYPSTVLMAVIPAQVAGVGRIAVASPPGPDGVSPLVLAACGLLGVEEIYQVGGVQAVGALAYGTGSIRAVDKIVGPGNAYVTCAKKLLYGVVGIDFLAGPSEVVVVCDGGTPPAEVAAELLAQAEHDPEARVFCFVVGEASEASIASRLEAMYEGLPAYCRDVLGRDGVFRRFPGLAEAMDAVNEIAPEHLALKVRDPQAGLERVRNAGAVMLGRSTPVALGDYFAGPSHVLPTGGTARFDSGLGTRDFMKAVHVLETPDAYLRRWGPAVAALARAEGLEAHARTVDRSAS
jgi:histidinol dehydrogenase